MNNVENFLKICEEKGMRMAKIETLEELKDIAMLSILYRYTIDKH